MRKNWLLQGTNDIHVCEPNRAKVTVVLLRPKNKETVRSNPTEAVGKEIWTVIIEASNRYSYEEKNV